MPSRTQPAEPFDGRVPPPVWANIETTKFCNLRCRMCVQFNDGTTVAGPHMPLDEFERIAYSVFPYVERWQPSVAGEPTMSRGFEQMLAIAEQFGVKGDVFTNGTLLSESMIERLAPNLGCLHISFDGATKATFEAIREGAVYEDVVEKVRRLVDWSRQHLPANHQPSFGLNCTLMEKNVRELPDLVRLAKEFGLDHMSCYHVFPVTAEMRLQSLVHHRELARERIDTAFRVAKELRFPLRIEALDQLTAATALGPGMTRVWSEKDGVVEGLEAREYFGEGRPTWPLPDTRSPGFAAIQQRRAEAMSRSGLPERRAGDPEAAAGESIWWCDFLWNRTYVTIGGHVRPCCVFGVPVLGNVAQEPFEQVWNNEAHRAMRQRMASKHPVIACRGCMHIKEIEDPVEIDRLLQGRRVPRPEELEELPAVLDPGRQERHRKGSPPVLEWEAVAGAREYVLEFSLDGFASILFSTKGPKGGPAIREARWPVPSWAWRDAPVDREIHWRVFAQLPSGPREVQRGSVPPEP
ncbi:MAG TPA: radical SAM protein [Planctomycetota bacterium]